MSPAAMRPPFRVAIRRAGTRGLHEAFLTVIELRYSDRFRAESDSTRDVHRFRKKRRNGVTHSYVACRLRIRPCEMRSGCDFVARQPRKRDPVSRGAQVPLGAKMVAQIVAFTMHSAFERQATFPLWRGRPPTAVG